VMWIKIEDFFQLKSENENISWSNDKMRNILECFQSASSSSANPFGCICCILAGKYFQLFTIKAKGFLGKCRCKNGQNLPKNAELMSYTKDGLVSLTQDFSGLMS